MSTEYTVLRSRRRTLSMELKHDGKLVVHAPRQVSDAQIADFVQKHGRWLENARARLAQRAEAHPEPTEEERGALIARARVELPLLVQKWSAVMGLRPTGITITSARTRFGSCSAKDRLSFSWRLMQYPDEAVELVVIHELCHIVHKNHGAEFYALLEKHLPDHKERRKLLKE